jgi:transposase InsO family protein
MTYVRTSPYYPQSNGKMERWYKTLKSECIRVKVPLNLEDARRFVTEFVAHYNEDRATWRHDPSADPGAKAEGGAA